MPELPEVEIMSRNLRKWLGSGPVQVVGLEPGLPTAEMGPVTVERRGKTCLVRGDAGTLVLHFRMTGKVVLGEHERARAVFRGERVVSFVDARRLGTLRLVEDVDLSGLGPDAWPERRDGAWWRQRFARKRGPIKPALLDQRCVAGLGNIAASEICWRIGVDPRRGVPSLAPEEWERLAEQAWAFLDEVIEAEDGDEILYLNADPGAQNPFSVYGREGEPCPASGRRIERLVQSGRSTYWVPGHQS